MTKPLWVSPMARRPSLTFSSHITLEIRENHLRYRFEKWRMLMLSERTLLHFRCSFPAPLRRFSSCAFPLHVTIFDAVAQRQICRSWSLCTLNSSPQLVYCRTNFIWGGKEKKSQKCRVWLTALGFSFLPHAPLPPNTTAFAVDDFKPLQELHFSSTTHLRAF